MPDEERCAPPARLELRDDVRGSASRLERAGIDHFRDAESVCSGAGRFAGAAIRRRQDRFDLRIERGETPRDRGRAPRPTARQGTVLVLTRIGALLRLRVPQEPDVHEIEV